MIPTIGRTVLYTLSEQDAQAINRRRTTGASIAERIGGTVLSEDGCVKGALWPVGAQAHIGNEVKADDVFPLVIVRTWGDTEGSAFNGQLMLDGTDTFWVTSTSISDEPKPGYCHVPPRV